MADTEEREKSYHVIPNGKRWSLCRRGHAYGRTYPTKDDAVMTAMCKAHVIYVHDRTGRVEKKIVLPTKSS